VVERLERERLADLERALAVPSRNLSAGARAWVLPDEAWSRRVLGIFANRRARDDPGRAQLLLAPLPGGGFVASVRTPAGCPTSAVDFCRRYPGGGGRTTAAGVEWLDAAEVEPLIAAFAVAFAGS
jgi:hypothetical protein